MIFNATNLISETFDQRGVKYRINDFDILSDIEAGYKITGGPVISIRFISNGEKNDVAVRVLGLFNGIPAEKRAVMLEACNQLMKEIRFLKFCLDDKNDINVEYDFAMNTPDDAIGECCFEMLARMMTILDQKYSVLARALYGEQQDNKARDLTEALKLLRGMQKEPISIIEQTKE